MIAHESNESYSAYARAHECTITSSHSLSGLRKTCGCCGQLDRCPISQAPERNFGKSAKVELLVLMKAHSRRFQALPDFLPNPRDTPWLTDRQTGSNQKIHEMVTQYKQTKPGRETAGDQLHTMALISDFEDGIPLEEEDLATLEATLVYRQGIAHITRSIIANLGGSSIGFFNDFRECDCDRELKAPYWSRVCRGRTVRCLPLSAAYSSTQVGQAGALHSRPCGLQQVPCRTNWGHHESCCEFELRTSFDRCLANSPSALGLVDVFLGGKIIRT